MHNVQLNQYFREDAINRIGKALEATYTGNKDVFDISVLKLCKHTEQNLAFSSSGSHMPGNFLWSLRLMPRARNTALFITCLSWLILPMM